MIADTELHYSNLLKRIFSKTREMHTLSANICELICKLCFVSFIVRNFISLFKFFLTPKQQYFFACFLDDSINRNKSVILSDVNCEPEFESMTSFRVDSRRNEHNK